MNRGNTFKQENIDKKGWQLGGIFLIAIDWDLFPKPSYFNFGLKYTTSIFEKDTRFLCKTQKKHGSLLETESVSPLNMRV